MVKKELRKNIVPIRYTDGEHRLIKKKSEKEKLGVSTWLRKISLEAAERKG